MENSAEGKPSINREIKILEFAIQLYLCYNEHEALSSCNTAFYLTYFNQTYCSLVITMEIYVNTHRPKG